MGWRIHTGSRSGKRERNSSGARGGGIRGQAKQKGVRNTVFGDVQGRGTDERGSVRRAGRVIREHGRGTGRGGRHGVVTGLNLSGKAEQLGMAGDVLNLAITLISDHMYKLEAWKCKNHIESSFLSLDLREIPVALKKCMMLRPSSTPVQH